MGENNIWKEVELYFQYEFIENLDEDSKEKIQKSISYYFIENDFKIYQQKSYPYDELNETDFEINNATFHWMLYNLHVPRVKNLIKYHFDNFAGDKIDFLEFVYHDLAGSKLTRGNIELPIPQQKKIVMDWCKSKLDEIKNIEKKPEIKLNKTFISEDRISDLRSLNIDKFDLTKLIKLIEEVNHNYSFKNFLSVAMLCRAIIDHIPPILGYKTFNEIANNYGNRSFKNNMEHLNKSMRSIADNYLHMTIRQSESLPNETQVDFSREIDFLLAEIIRVNK